MIISRTANNTTYGAQHHSLVVDRTKTGPNTSTASTCSIRLRRGRSTAMRCGPAGRAQVAPTALGRRSPSKIAASRAMRSRGAARVSLPPSGGWPPGKTAWELSRVWRATHLRRRPISHSCLTCQRHRPDGATLGQQAMCPPLSSTSTHRCRNRDRDTAQSNLLMVRGGSHVVTAAARPWFFSHASVARPSVRLICACCEPCVWHARDPVLDTCTRSVRVAKKESPRGRPTTLARDLRLEAPLYRLIPSPPAALSLSASQSLATAVYLGVVHGPDRVAPPCIAPLRNT